MLKFVSHVEVGVLNFVFTCYFHEVFFISTWEDWKAARGLMSAVTPKFVADADLSELTNPKMPQLKVCTMTAAGHLQLPDATRKKWLDDPVRSSMVIFMLTLSI